MTNFPLHRESSQPRGWAQVCLIAGQIVLLAEHTKSQESWNVLAHPFSIRSSSSGIKSGSLALLLGSFTNWGYQGYTRILKEIIHQKNFTEISSKVGSMLAPVSHSCLTLWDHGACQAPLSLDFSGKDSAAWLLFLLQESSWLKDQLRVPGGSYTGRQIIYHWATGKPQRGEFHRNKKKRKKENLL